MGIYIFIIINCSYGFKLLIAFNNHRIPLNLLFNLFLLEIKILIFKSHLYYCLIMIVWIALILRIWIYCIHYHWYFDIMFKTFGFLNCLQHQTSLYWLFWINPIKHQLHQIILKCQSFTYWIIMLLAFSNL